MTTITHDFSAPARAKLDIWHYDACTSQNGDKWLCIARHNDIVWLVAIHDGRPLSGPAYSFRPDGTPICLGSDSNYRIASSNRTVAADPMVTRIIAEDGV
jgi:hypothetical protein